MAASVLRENVLPPVPNMSPYWTLSSCPNVRQPSVGTQAKTLTTMLLGSPVGEWGGGGLLEWLWSLLPAVERVEGHWGELRAGRGESRKKGQMVLPGQFSSQSTPIQAGSSDPRPLLTPIHGASGRSSSELVFP